MNPTPAKTRFAHERLTNHQPIPTVEVVGGYALKDQNSGIIGGIGLAFMAFTAVSWVGGALLMLVVSLFIDDGFWLRLMSAAAFAAGLYFAYVLVVTPWLVRQRFQDPYFAINDHPLHRGQEYGMSFQRLLRSGFMPPACQVMVKVSCANVTATQRGTTTFYDATVLWEHDIELNQSSSEQGFVGQWNVVLPEHLPASEDGAGHWIEWQVAIKMFGKGVPNNLLQYKLWVK
jgi:hypothetical protein